MPQVTVAAADGGRFSAYLSDPVRSGAKVPGIVAMQQIYGVTDEMRGFTDDFAAHGYLAICPDLYWRIEPGISIDPLEESAHQKALTYIRKFDNDKAVEDLKATIAYLRSHPNCNGKVGTVGYCQGGLMAFLLAARGAADCNVGYFGVGIERHIAEADNVSAPLMLHIPEKDRIVPPAAQKIVREGLDGKAEIFTYPDADHAFNRVGADTYDADVTALAYDRTAAFLKQYLGG